jgi:hypothetical protein
MLGNNFKQYQGNIQFSIDKKAVESLLAFLSDNIPDFPAFLKSNTSRKLNEDRISGKLEIFLQRHARSDNSIFMFQFQTPLEGKRSTDLSVIYAAPYSTTEPFFIIEAKRLPTPGNGRDREYVQGDLGAMERFKRGHHGKNLEQSAILGYVEKEDHDHWHKQICSWITDLINANTDTSIVWDKNDLLTFLKDIQGIHTYKSLNKRAGITEIKLTHFLININ